MPDDDPQPPGPAANADLFRLLAENVLDYALFVIDADRRVRTWGLGAERLLGYMEAEILGERADRFFTPEDFAAGGPEAEVRQALETGRGDDDRWHVRKDGSRFWSAGVLTPLRDRNGSLHGFAKIMRDQTALHEADQARRESEERLRESDERFRGLMDQAPFSVQIFSAGGQTLRVNRAWEEMWGIPADRIGGYNILADPQLEAKGIAPHVRRAFAGTPAALPEIAYDPNETIPGATRYDDPVRWVSAVAYPIKNAAGDVREVVLVHEDITARRRAKEEVREQAAALAGILAASVDHIYVVGADGRYRYVSTGGARALGLEPEAVTGRHWRELGLPADVMTPFDADRDEALRSGRPVRREVSFVGPGGEARRYEYMVAPVSPDGGEADAVVAVSRDVTDRRRAEDALRASEERFRRAADAAPVLIWVADTTKLCVWFNKPWLDFTGRTHEQEYGYGWADGIHPDDRDRCARIYDESFDARRPFTMEYRLRRRDGEYRWVLDSGVPLYEGPGGEFSGYIGSCVDITARTSAEAALRESELRYRTLFDSIDEGFCVIEMLFDDGLPVDYRFLEVNPGFERQTGLGDVAGRRIRELAPDHEPHWFETYGRVAATGESVRFANEARALGGRWFDVNAFRVGGPESRKVAVLFSDITERQRAEAGLRRAERTSRFLADASAALAGLADYESTLQKVARLAVPHFADWCAIDMIEGGSLRRVAVAHVDPAKVELAHEVYRRFPPDPDALQGAWNILRTGTAEIVAEIDDGLLEASVKDAALLAILRELGLRSYIGVPLKVRDRVLGVVTFIAAESGRRYDAADLAVAEDLAHRAAVAVENVRLYDEVREADRRKDEFLAMLGHELRNPLAPIKSGLDLLKMSGGEGEVVDLMAGQVEHLVRLVDDLLDVSRILRGRVELKRATVELDDVVRRAVEAARPMFSAERQEFSVTLPSDPVRLDADPVRLAQIFTNLLTNASKYTEAGGRISLAADAEGRHVVIRVSDSGIGIDPHLLRHVFDLFTQSTRAIDRSQGGLGIGLTIVKSLVEMHGGTVIARSDGPGRGSEFVVRLPVAETAAEPPAAPDEHRSTTARRILVVDDNVPAAKLLVRLLGKLGRHEVVTAYDGEGALAAAEAYRPDLILLDIGLPKLDGYEVARRLRARPEFSDTLLVALTGYGTEADRRKSREAGFDEHVTKPPGIDLLRKVLAHPKFPRT